MKITLDLDTNIITVPKNYFKIIDKQNELITKMGGEKVKIGRASCRERVSSPV